MMIKTGPLNEYSSWAFCTWKRKKKLGLSVSMCRILVPTCVCRFFCQTTWKHHHHVKGCLPQWQAFSYKCVKIDLVYERCAWENLTQYFWPAFYQSDSEVHTGLFYACWSSIQHLFDDGYGAFTCARVRRRGQAGDSIALRASVESCAMFLGTFAFPTVFRSL